MKKPIYRLTCPQYVLTKPAEVYFWSEGGRPLLADLISHGRLLVVKREMDGRTVWLNPAHVVTVEFYGYL